MQRHTDDKRIKLQIIHASKEIFHIISKWILYMCTFRSRSFVLAVEKRFGVLYLLYLFGCVHECECGVYACISAVKSFDSLFGLFSITANVSTDLLLCMLVLDIKLTEYSTDMTLAHFKFVE